MSALILALGLTFFPGQPHWYELNTAGVEWTVHEAPTLIVAPATYGAPLTADEYGKRSQ